MLDSVAKLVAQAQQDDRSAQRRLYELFHRQVFRIAVRMAGVGEAADLTQQVFLQVFRKIDQFAGRSRFETWLIRLTVNECLQYRRRAARSVVDSLKHEPAEASPVHTHRTECRDLLEQALARVEPHLKSIFLLREVEELSYSEIADVLGIPQGTVASRLNQARRELRERLVELGWEP